MNRLSSVTGWLIITLVLLGGIFALLLTGKIVPEWLSYAATGMLGGTGGLAIGKRAVKP